MIDLAALRRVRIRRGTVVHEVPDGRPLRTACGKPVKLEGPTGRRYDEPLPDRTVVTCRRCPATAGMSGRPGGDGLEPPDSPPALASNPPLKGAQTGTRGFVAFRHHAEGQVVFLRA
ncbi:hypothetical protein GCM10010440_59280 [Kitasatospora cinereorecta]